MRRISLLLLGLLLCIGAKAQDEKFKALFMYNFTKYIEYPASKQAGNFVIAVVGDSPIISELQTIAEKKTVGQQKIEVKKIAATDDVTKYHIVFVPESKSASAADIASKIVGKGVVLITDKPGLGKTTSGINYVSSGGKQSFEVNQNRLKEHGVNVASALVTLGKAVE
ncbi:MAG: YfiR family protein [Salinivirgaceae bacterium]|nr:YfiR family protein [Salinivirgaceae bacterium]